MKIPLYSSTIRRSEMDAVLTCMVDEKVGPGEMAEKLERRVKETFNVSGALALRSPSIALFYALEIMELPENAGVMISALAPAWQYTELQRHGFTPIVLDVDPKTALVTPIAIENGIKAGGRVLVLHETLGFLPDIDYLLSFEIPIIEDISQSAGGTISVKAENQTTEKYAGSFGMFSILGMEEQDILTSGGGAVLIAPERRDAIVLKKAYDSAPSTDKLPDINAALGFIQIKQMEKNMETRREIQKLFNKSLMTGKHESFSVPDNVNTAVYSFPVILSRGFNDVQKYAKKKQIEIQLAFSGCVADFLGGSSENTPVANSLLLRTALFPLYPRLGSKKAEAISKVLSTLP